MNDELKLGHEEEGKDQNDYKELYGGLRNTISTSRESLGKALSDVRAQLEQIELQRKALDSQEEILKLKKNKLEGAIEVAGSYLKANLPSNKK